MMPEGAPHNLREAGTKVRDSGQASLEYIAAHATCHPCPDMCSGH
jgi:hypothetical protein